MNVNDEMNISPEPSVLNGNAAAGLLQQIFAVDVTTAGITCGACEVSAETARQDRTSPTEELDHLTRQFGEDSEHL